MILLIKTMFNLPLCWQADGFSLCQVYFCSTVSCSWLLYREIKVTLQDSISNVVYFWICMPPWLLVICYYLRWGFPSSSVGKASACNTGDPGAIPGLGRSPGGGNGTPLQYSSLENPMDRGAWWATVHGVAKSRTWLSNWHALFMLMTYHHTVFIYVSAGGCMRYLYFLKSVLWITYFEILLIVARKIKDNTVSCWSAQLWLTLCDPMDCKPSRFLCPWHFPGKNTGVGCHFLLQTLSVIWHWNKRQAITFHIKI